MPEDKKERRLMSVRVSVELLQELFTLGWSTDRDYIIECIKGLPEGAEFLAVRQVYSEKIIELIFSHPSFEIIEPFQLIPTIAVEHGKREK